MSLEFNNYKIDDIGEVISGGTPSTSKNEYWNGDISWITPKDLSTYDDIYISKGERNISQEGLDNSSARLVPRNTILMTSRAPIGYIAIADKELSTNQGFKSLICDESICHYKYFYYWLKLNIKYIINNSNGSTFKEISGGTFKNLEISLPPIDKQKRITSILWNIDERISILKKMNKNLILQLETIYNSYFVFYNNFSKEELKECEIGLIPKDWDLLTLGEVTTKLNDRVGKDDYAVFSAVKTGNLKLSAEYFDKQVFSKNIRKYIIVKQKQFAYNPARINIGSIGRNDFDFDGCVSPVYVAFEVEKGYENFMNMFIKTSMFNQWVNTLSSGSVRQTLNYEDFSIIKIAYPPIEYVIKFNEIYENYYKLINHNKKVIKNLENLKDTLLPKLMSGEIDVSKINCDLKKILLILYEKNYKFDIEDYKMKTKIISKIQDQMKPYLDSSQYLELTKILLNSMKDVEVIDNNNELNEIDNFKLLNLFLSAKQVEGCSNKTIVYYKSTIEKMLKKIKKQVYNISTDDLRKYLFNHKNAKNSSKTTIDNIRRIFSSFFSWLEDEDYILKNPVRRIHRVKTGRVVKEVLTDENLEILRDNCEEIRDLSLVELLISTGIRVGELVHLNIDDVDFYERECIVFGKGESERVVYFDARTKIHLIEYLQSRTDNNPALFVSLNKPFNRLGISGVENRLRELGKKCNITKVHPHKFRRTMATNVIDKGMPIEQVQKLLGHVQIDTTMQYAMVNQNNVKLAHRKFIG